MDTVRSELVSILVLMIYTITAKEQLIVQGQMADYYEIKEFTQIK